MSELGRRQKQVSVSEIDVDKSMSGKWTNEKHSSFLNSMEAMFVKQLYNQEYKAMDSPKWRSRRKTQLNPSLPDQSKTKPRTTGQFKVFESGCWKTYNSVGAPRGAYPTDLPNNGALCNKGDIVRRHATVSNQSFDIISVDQYRSSSYSYKEVSDQNFVDDEPKQTTHLSRKRMKANVSNTTFSDQVVPTAQSPLVINSGTHYEGENHNTTAQGSSSPKAVCGYFKDEEPNGDP